MKLENLLHKFFADARLDIEILDRFGKPIKPREWLLLSIEIIDEAASRPIDSTIIDYRFNGKIGRIERINSG